MRYKIGDKVVLRDEIVQDFRLCESTGVIEAVHSSFYELEGVALTVEENDIDHEKTAKLNNNSPEKIVAEKNNREHVDAIEPAHYRQGNIDRIEVWYQTYPFEGFRWAMKSHIDKYIHRYESKGGVEDLDKATYFIKRLKEKEMEECSN